MSSHTTVERRPGRGRCMVAAKNFGPGDLIMAVEPLSAVLEEDQARAYCAGCFKTIDCQHGGGRGGEGSRCSRCKRIWYCSRKCQKWDWREHRQECKAWTSQESARTPTRTLRLAGRILNLMNRREDDDEGAGNETDNGASAGAGSAVHDDGNSASKTREAVDELVDHNDERSPEQKQQYMLMATFVARLCVAGSGGGGGGGGGGGKKGKGKRGSALSWPSAGGRGIPGLVDAVFAVLGKLSCNVFSIVGGTEGGTVGCGLYLDAAAANHSCRPDASQSFDGKTLSLRCTRPISRGEEITIGITQISRPGPTRRESLRTSYFFECRCERCESPSGRAEDARLEAYACPDRTCAGLCLVPTKRGDVLGGHSSSSSSNAHHQDQSPLPPSDRGSGALQGEPAGPEGTASGVAVGRRQEGNSFHLSSLHPPLSEVSVGVEADEGLDPDRLKCCKCGSASRRVEEAQREREGIQELLKRGKAFEEAGEDLAARGSLEQALRRAGTCLHRGNWVLTEIYSTLTSVCVGLRDFDAAAGYASESVDVSRACLAGLIPYFEPWGSRLAFAGKLLLCVRRQPEKALPLLLEAEASIKVTHGVSHPVYASVRDLLDQAEHTP
ncbi:unnamed protein product [Pylaiella littoralis]